MNKELKTKAAATARYIIHYGLTAKESATPIIKAHFSDKGISGSFTAWKYAVAEALFEIGYAKRQAIARREALRVDVDGPDWKADYNRAIAISAK